MLSLNKVQLFGNLTRDPELKTFQDGGSVCKVGVATNREWKDKNGEKQQEVTFHNLVIWGKRGEAIAQYMKKGQNAYFEGHLRNNEWEDESGQKKVRTEIVVDDFQFGINKRDEERGASAAAPSEQAAPPSASAESESEPAVDDLPF